MRWEVDLEGKRLAEIKALGTFEETDPNVCFLIAFFDSNDEKSR
jgi:hypothetical protein